MTIMPNINVPTDISAFSAPALQAQTQSKMQSGQGKDAIDAVAQDFEAVFLTQMFQHMFKGLDADPLFGGGQAESTYRSLMMNEYGKEVAQHGGIGLAEHVSRTLLATQEV